MAMISLAELRNLLQEDRILRDYFNTFLNLPIFCRRVTYSGEVGTFETDPTFQSHHHSVDDSVEEVLSWVYCERLPLFWSSHLHHEYELCLRLNIGVGGPSLLSGVVEMGHFRLFLSGTEGGAACLFWLDVQHFLHKLHTSQTVERDTATFIKWIRTHYMNEDAPLRLSSEIRTKLMTKLCCLNPGHSDQQQQPCGSVTDSSHTHCRHIQAITEAQTQALASLMGYWYNVWASSKKRSASTDKITADICDKATIDKSQISAKYLPDLKAQSDCHHKTTVVPPTELVVRLPDVNSTVFGKTAAVTPSPVSNPLFSSSTANLFPHSNTPLLSDAAHTARKEYFRLAPFLTASLRADSLAGSPLLHYLTCHCPDSCAVNYLLFWQSAELIFMMDEMRRWYSPKRRWRGGECPCNNYRDECYPIAKTPTELVQLFLMKGAPHMIELASHHRERLSMLLPKGLGQSLLLSVQEYAALQLLSPWKEFLYSDNQSFIEHCAREKTLTTGLHSAALLSPSDIVHTTYGSSKLQGMWLALRLAEASKYPGTISLPSRRQSDLMYRREMEPAAKEKKASISLRMRDLTGVPLNSMLTTVHHTMQRDGRRSLHTILSVTKPLHPTEQEHKKKKKPGNFKEVVKDREQMEQFHRFLVSRGGDCEVQLLFWLAVEDLKSTMTNESVCTRKMDRIVSHFFKDSEARRVLQCSESLVRPGSSPGHLELLTVQSLVEEVLERLWHSRYVVSLTVEEKKEEETGEDEQSHIKKAPICIEHTKDLWRMFARGVISFRRGLMDPDTADDFKSYLREEVVRGSGGSHKKVVGTKVVYVTKLLNDLSFWAEVERYKDIADIVRETKRGRQGTPEDDIIVHKKAHAIINCYIDSAVIPRVQINIPTELVQYILDCVSQGEISRGLFHEAALNIFSVLILYWKKYLTIRHTRKKTAEGSKPSHTTHHHSPHKAPNLHKVASFRMSHTEHHNFLDIGPTLSFSLTAGLHWVHPSHRHHLELAPTDPSHLHPHLSQRHSSLRSHNSKRFSVGSLHHSSRSIQRLSRHTPTATSLSVTTPATVLSPTPTN